MLLSNQSCKKIHWPYFLVLIFGVSWQKCNCHAFKFSAFLSTHSCNSGKWELTWSWSGINELLTLYWRIYVQAFWSVQYGTKRKFCPAFLRLSSSSPLKTVGVLACIPTSNNSCIETAQNHCLIVFKCFAKKGQL